LRACPQPGCESGAYGDLGQFYQGVSCTNPGEGVYIPCSGGFINPQSCNHWVVESNNCEAGYHTSDRPLGYTTQQYADSGYCSINDFVISALGYDTWSGSDNTIRLPCVPN
jgi:hypothetical protein